MHVVDTIAPSLPALLRQLDGYRTKDPQRPFTLHLAGAQITTVSPGFSTRFLNTLIDPNLISILFLVGIAGLVFEVLHPGVVLPGAIGAVSLTIALFGFSILPLSWAGLALVVLGVALLVIDLHATTHGALTIARTDLPWRRPSAALRATHRRRTESTPSRRRHRPRDRRLLGLRHQQGDRGPTTAGEDRTADARRHEWRGAPKTVSCSSTGSCGERTRATARELLAGERVEVDALDGLELTVTPTPRGDDHDP